MATSIRIYLSEKKKPRSVINAVLALLTGLGALIYPNFLYYFVGIYLIVLGIIFFLFRFNSFLTAAALLAGIFIWIFPESIPITFALFLIVLGLITLLSGGFIVIGAISLMMATLIFLFPGFISYLIGIFLLLYGATHLIYMMQQSREGRL